VSDADAVPTSSASEPGIPGWWVVLGMFALGLAATAVIFIYWDLHTKPFRPLTEAIGREYRHSLPKVEGGRHKGSANTLRVAMRVPFVPTESSPEAHRVVNRVVELAREHADLARFEKLEVHLIQVAPEQMAVQQTFEFSAPSVMKSLPFNVQDEEP
jgi:hypothetical protein